MCNLLSKFNLDLSCKTPEDEKALVNLGIEYDDLVHELQLFQENEIKIAHKLYKEESLAKVLNTLKHVFTRDIQCLDAKYKRLVMAQLGQA